MHIHLCVLPTSVGIFICVELCFWMCCKIRHMAITATIRRCLATRKAVLAHRGGAQN